MPLFNPSSGADTLIETVTFSGSEATKTISLPSIYRGLWMEASLFKNSTGNGELRIEANGDTTTTKYYQQRFSSANTNTATQVLGTVGYWGGLTIPNTTDYANASSTIVLEVLDYTSTNRGKVLTTTRNFGANTSSGSMAIQIETNHWGDLAALTSLRFYLAAGNFDAKSYIRVYGMV